MRTHAHRQLLITVVLAMLPILLYATSLWNGFVNWDDGPLILENPWIRGLTWENIRHAFTSYDPELYVPLTLTSYQMTYMIGELNPFWFHGGNLLLHVINVLLVYMITFKLTRRLPAAIAVGLLFAVHPLHVEAVVWAAARKDVLSGTFLLLTFLSFLKFRETTSRKWYAASLLSVSCGLLSKVSIITAPLLIPGIDWLQGRMPLRRALRDALPFVGLSVLFGIISFFGKVTNTSFTYEKILIGAKAVIFLLQRIFLPWNLTALYPYTQPISLTNPDLLFSLFGVTALTACSIYAVRWSRWLFFGWTFFLLLIIPSFANAMKGRNELLDVYITSDRYAYIASLGPLLLIGLLFDELARRWRTCAWATLFGVVCVLSVLTFRQSRTWRDSETFFRHAVAVSPNSYIAHQNLGTIAVRRGDIDEGLREYMKVLKIRPDAVTYYNIGLIMESRDDIPAAIEAYRRAVETSPLEEEAAERLLQLTE